MASYEGTITFTILSCDSEGSELRLRSLSAVMNCQTVMKSVHVNPSFYRVYSGQYTKHPKLSVKRKEHDNEAETNSCKVPDLYNFGDDFG